MTDTWDDDTDDDDACTQDKVARHLARDQAGRLRYCAEQRAWYVFDGAIWRRDRTGLVLQRARELTRALGTKPKFGIVGARFASERPAWSNMRFVSGVEKFARADPAFAVTADIFDADPFLLGTPDGPVALKSGRRLGADPSQNLSKATAVGPAETAACPRWRTFLGQTFGDPALTLFLQRYFGYALTGDTSEQVLLFGHGTGGNGKSVFARTIAGLMGDYAETCVPGTFTRAFTCAGGGAERHPTEIARLAGARLVSHAETASAHAWDETRIKLLTGGDPVTARFTHADAFTFTPRFKLFILGNHRPALARVDEAMARRLLIVPFRHRPDVPDRGLPDALKAEGPGILRWLIEGCLAWQARGLDPPASVREATADYLAGEDVLGQFLDEACACAPGDPTKTAPSGALFAAWSSFARDAGAPIGSPRGFAEALQARGFFRGRIHAGRIFCGLSLKAADTMSVTP